MQTRLFIFFLLIAGIRSEAQQIDSIYFHLYTDSLKKGQHNYINVDAKLKNGHWLPLTSRELIFACPEASFEGNELILPENFKPEKVNISATLRENPAIKIERTVWVKKRPDPLLN